MDPLCAVTLCAVIAIHAGKQAQSQFSALIRTPLFPVFLSTVASFRRHGVPVCYNTKVFKKPHSIYSMEIKSGSSLNNFITV